MNGNHNVECTRYGEEGENQRVRETLAYAAGLSGGKLSSSGLLSLHDHKGQLEALWATKLAYLECHKFIDQAWTKWASENPADHYLFDYSGVAFRHNGRTFFDQRLQD